MIGATSVEAKDWHRRCSLDDASYFALVAKFLDEGGRASDNLICEVRGRIYAIFESQSGYTHVRALKCLSYWENEISGNYSQLSDDFTHHVSHFTVLPLIQCRQYESDEIALAEAVARAALLVRFYGTSEAENSDHISSNIWKDGDGVHQPDPPASFVTSEAENSDQVSINIWKDGDEVHQPDPPASFVTSEAENSDHNSINIRGERDGHDAYRSAYFVTSPTESSDDADDDLLLMGPIYDPHPTHNVHQRMPAAAPVHHIYIQMPAQPGDQISRCQRWEPTDAVLSVMGQAASVALTRGVTDFTNAPKFKWFIESAVVLGFICTFAGIGLFRPHPRFSRLMSKAGGILTIAALLTAMFVALPPVLSWPLSSVCLVIAAYTFYKS